MVVENVDFSTLDREIIAYSGIKTELLVLKNLLKNKTDSDSREMLERLKREAEEKKQVIQQEIKNLSKKIEKLDNKEKQNENKRLERIIATIDEETKNVDQLYKEIVESLWSSLGQSTTSVSQASTFSAGDKNIFQKAWWWIWDQLRDIFSGDERKEKPLINSLRVLWFAATWVSAAALINDDEDDNNKEKSEWEENEDNSESEWEDEWKSFWNSWFWKALKWLWIWSAAGGWIYFLGKKFNWWWSSEDQTDDKKDNQADGKKDNDSNWKTDNGKQGNKQQEFKEKPKESDIVSIKDFIPDIKYDLVYATSNNSFRTVIYKDGESSLKLRYDAIEKLIKVQESLKEQWLELKIWDAYRDHDAQVMLRNNYKGPDTPANPKSNNVAIPVGVKYFHPGQRVWKNWTWSHHWTWKAVDLTLVDSSTWKELLMPTWFDDFSWKAGWANVNKNKDSEAFKNAYKLRDAMKKAGFYTIGSERWHYQTDAPRSPAPEVAH